MAEAQKARNAKEEKEVREEIDYDNTVKDYNEKKADVESAVDMIATEFWRKGFKLRREIFEKAHSNLSDVIVEKTAEDYDSVENVKAVNKAKLAFTNSIKDFDNYISDVQKVVDVMHIFCADEDLALFNDLPMMTPTFSRKTGKISMKKVK